MPDVDQPFSELAQYELDRASIRLLPEPFCRRNNGRREIIPAEDPIE